MYILIIIICLLVLFSLSGCKKNKNKNTSSSEFFGPEQRIEEFGKMLHDNTYMTTEENTYIDAK